MKPKISIITPCYNQGRYLEENILSVVNQNYPDVEHIVIDDGSTDNTKDILEKYKSKLSYSETQTNSGQSAALNKAFTKATGEIIGWLNSDDYYPPGALHAVADAFADPMVNVVSGNSVLFYETGKQEKGIATVTPTRNLAFHLRGPDINQPPTFFRRKTMAEIMPLNTSLRYTMDREMWIKYLLLYGLDHVKTVDDTLAYFRYHSTSNSQSKSSLFYDDYASILHWFALKHGLTEIASALAYRYTLVPNYSYSFAKYPDRETTMNMLRFFFLKHGGLVFEKHEFAYAKRMFPLLKFKEYTPLPEEENAMKRMMNIQGCINWPHFRIKRKYKHLVGGAS